MHVLPLYNFPSGSLKENRSTVRSNFPRLAVVGATVVVVVGVVVDVEEVVVGAIVVVVVVVGVGVEVEVVVVGVGVVVEVVVVDSQSGCLNPAGHSQLGPKGVLVHVPPLRQGRNSQ